MKLLIKSSIVSLLLLASSSLFAGNVAPGFTIKNTEKKILHVDGKDMLLQSFEISFQDAEGTALFSEYVIDPTTFDRNYNLSELPKGRYNLLIEMETKTLVLPVWVKSEGLKIDLAQIKAVQ